MHSSGRDGNRQYGGIDRSEQVPVSWWSKKHPVGAVHIIIGVAIVVLFVGMMANNSARLREVQGELVEVQRQLAAAVDEVGELERQLAFSTTDAFFEQQARERFGYMMPDETRFVPDESYAESIEE